MNNKVQIIMVIAMTFAFSFAIANFQNALAQNQSNQTTSANQSAFPVNTTAASITGESETLLANQTTIPAQQVTIRVDQTTEPIDNASLLQPLPNQTIQPQTPNLAAIENDTMVTATGPAVTTIVNKTSVPFNQTIVQTENLTDASQQQPQQQNQSQQQPQQQNQSQGPLGQLGEAVGNILPG
ncbi:MAG: hypothetical protein M3Y25_02935 [Thermoproteota archaeon]|nr:hypothetical protein [Thermoproteota archaeon]